MKLSVSAFRAQASAQRKILSSYQNQLNYGACTSFPALGGFKLDEKPQMLVDSTGIGPPPPPPPPPPTSDKPDDPHESPETSQEEADDRKLEDDAKEETAEGATTGTNQDRRDEGFDKSPNRSTRTKSNQRWMKLRTTVQLSGAITSTNQKSKPPLKREDSFLKRFSTRQIPETQETVDTGDDMEAVNGSQTHNEVTRRRRKRRKELSKTVVNPDENFYFYWLMTVTMCVLYNLWTLIVRQSFPELQRAASAFWYSGDGFTDVVFVCDIVVQFRTGYLEQGLMVYDSKKLASHYLKSRAFILDLLALSPLDFLQFNVGVNPILRFPRFLKIYRIYSYYYMVESRTVYPNLWRVVNLIHILLILAHWFGCFYYLLSEAEGFQGDWVYPYRPGDYATLTRKYLGSLYWSTLTLTTIGDLPTPETNAESQGRSKAMTPSGDGHPIPRRGHKSRLLQFNSNYGYLFTIISYLIGVFIFATIVGQVGNVITNRNANRLEFERLLDGAKTYMRHHKVPGGMKRRVLRWYDYSWSRGRIQGGGDINTALGLLPDKLKTELALHVNLSVLKKVTIFQECQPEFLHDLVLKMKAYIFTPGDLICRKGEVAREMFIIADGILDVISETGRVLTTMKAGDFFGEIGILNLDGLNKRTADVRSVGYSELFSLSREDVLTAMKDYPEAQEILQNLGRKRLMEAKNASKMHKAQAKQSKDHDSSGDSDNAGKRIVEKLRSDVKGLKNALRRSRRGTRTKEGLDGYSESTIGKSHGKKHSILRRMSHVQSSDEFEGTAEPVQSPIGTGVPLLQRLKCLKEKQERDREEKAKLKLTFQMSNANEEEPEIEPIGVGLPLTQRLKLLKQKEDREAAAAAALAAAGSAVKSEKTLGKGSNDTSKEEETPLSDSKSQKGGSCTSLETRESSETRRVPLIEKLCLGVREKNPPNVKSVQDAEATSSSAVISETQVEIPASGETDNSVPKSQRNKFEVPKSKDGWRLLKKSSITHSRWRRHDKVEVRKVGKRGTYLSKSDTVLEKQKTFDKEEEKRARSTSPPEDLKFGQGSMNEEFNRTDRSPYHIAKENSTLEKVPHTFTESTSNMRKYDSISDLSPEYSGLPFVKKLKILNERQKLAELEKELIVRSASLDVPERESNTTGGVLTRSQSEASTIEMRSNRDIMSKIRESLLPEKEYSEESMVSPESNETMERRHLKSILKKLSAEGSTSDEDQSFKMESKKRDNAELKKLLRAPTIEGYAARHKKLTKSVTFDRDTLSSPPEPETMASATPLEGAGKGSKSPDKRVDLRETMRCKCEAFGSGFSSPQEGLNPPPEASQETEMSLRSHTVQHPSGSFGDVQPKSNEDEFFGSVLMDIQQIVRNIMVEAESRFQVRCNNLKVEVRKREDIIHQLLERLRQLEQKNSSDLATAPTTDGSSHVDSLPDKSFLLEGSLETVLSVNLFQKKSRNDFAVFPPTTQEETIIRIDNDNDVYGGCEEPSPKATSNDWKFRLPFESQCVEDSYGDVENTEDDQFDMKDRISLLPRSNGNPPKRRLRKPFDSDEVPRQAQFDEVKRNRPGRDFFLRRNFSVDETQSTRKLSSCRRTIGNSVELDSRSRGRFMDRVTDLQRSFSCVQERDFVALDMDEESTSSDVEQPNNKDWEVQMLVEELEKNEKRRIGWNEDEGHDENERWMSETDEEQMEDVKRLQEEVNTLKKMVCESDLTRLTNSELDMLETIIEAKDQKISQIARSSSLDQDGKSQKQKKSTHITSVQESRVEEQRRKPTLRQKLGQAFSFDFHDIGSRKSKSPDGTSQDMPRKHKAGPCREQQSLTNLWHTSSLLRNRVIEDTVEVVSSQRTANVVSAGSSLPLLMSGSLNLGKQSEVRCSLPSLSGREPNFSECLPPEVNSSEDFNQSCDSVFENSEETASLPTGDTVMCTSSKTQEGEANGSLNNFIKSVGQKVKQVMACEVTAARSQVPTISKLCDEQSALKETKMGCGSREITSRASEVIPEEMKPSAGAPEDSFGSPPKTEPPDL